MSSAQWNQVVDAEFDFAAVEIFQDIDAAMRQRGKVVRQNVVITSPVVDDDVQLSGNWSLRQAHVFGLIWEGYPFFTGDANRRFVDTIQGDVAGPTALQRWGPAQMWTRLEYANTVLWRRRKPREIASPAAVKDIDDNTAIAGQKALLFPGTVEPRDCTVFRCVAPGNWERAPTWEQPDRLDSELAAPNRCPAWFFGFNGGGDYIGGYLYEQIRDTLNLMVWTVEDMRLTSTLMTFPAGRQAFLFSYTYVDGVVTDVQEQVRTDLGFRVYGERSRFGSGGLVIFRREHCVIDDVPNYGGFARAVVGYLQTQAGGFFGANPDYDFANLGESRVLFDSVAPRNRMYVIAATTATTLDFGMWGVPANPGLPADGVSEGFVGQVLSGQATRPVLLMKWNVPGGFPHQKEYPAVA